jgi:hypothetical protein
LMRRPAAQRVSGIELQTNNHLLHIWINDNTTNTNLWVFVVDTAVQPPQVHWIAFEPPLLLIMDALCGKKLTGEVNHTIRKQDLSGEVPSNPVCTLDLMNP